MQQNKVLMIKEIRLNLECSLLTNVSSLMDEKFKIIKFEVKYAEECSMLILRSIESSHQIAYSKEEIQSLITNYSVEKIIQKSKDRETFIAMNEFSEVCAISTVKNNLIKGLYVDPKHYCKRIGTNLLKFLETQINKDGHKVVELFASLNSEEFYRKAGYKVVEKYYDNNGPAFIMKKILDK